MPSGTSQTLTTTVKAPTLLQGVASNVLVSTFSVFGQPGDPNTNNNFLSVSTAGDAADRHHYSSWGHLDLGRFSAAQWRGESRGNGGSAISVAEHWQHPHHQSGGHSPDQRRGHSGRRATVRPVMALWLRAAVLGPASSCSPTTPPTAARSSPRSNCRMARPTSARSASRSSCPWFRLFGTTKVISIPATNFVPYPASGPAGPYPSSNLVSGISAYVSDVAVTVSNLEHTFPHDISMLLVGPGGQSAVLMSGCRLSFFGHHSCHHYL